MRQGRLDSKPSPTKPVLLTQVFEATKGFTFATMRHVMFVVWRDTPSSRAIAKIGQHVAEVTRKYPKVSAVIVVESLDFRPPDADARAAHAQLTKLHEHQVQGVALLVDGGSAKHSLYRFVMSTITLISAPTVTQKIFSSANAVSSWLTDLDPSLDKADLLAALKEARALGP